MRAGKLTSILVLSLLMGGLVGCGPSKEELAAQERARLEIERRTQQDAAKANKAITEMNQKMFKRMNASRPGATQPASPPTETQPASKP